MNNEFSPIGCGDSVQDQQREEKLLELYSQMIRVAYSKCRNKSDAQDAVQEAWVRILMKQDTLREQSKLSSWAKTITANVAININRQTMRAQASRLFDPAGETAGGGETALMLEIAELLSQLDSRSRTMLLYKFYYGFKDQEIADRMHIPVGTVKARIHRSKVQLKQWMGGMQQG
ncbi:RNA polymerase sigma factor [Paenibacillus humicola]|uniref:RNA polymerase sigma factor n=1 Tax=Paenibacillus humicola TaxID=3110540 RepID=UPI00237A5BE2|nr:RNA polymerase sigma factor [Paenibacillus humicola]